MLAASCSRYAVICVSLLAICSSLNAQSTGPTQAKNSQGQSELGLYAHAQVTVYVVDGPNGDFTNGTNGTVAQVATAATNVTNAYGLAAPITVNTDEVPDTVSGQPYTPGDNWTGASVTTPINVTMQATQAQIDNMGCTGASACTGWTTDSTTLTVTSSLTLVLPSVISDGGLPPVMAHEDGHGFMTLNDCTSACNSVMNLPITETSPTAPTPADNAIVNKQQSCSCNVCSN